MAIAALRDAKSVSVGLPPFVVAVTGATVGPLPNVAAAAACAQVLRLRYPDQLLLINSAFSMWLELYSSADTPARTASLLAGIDYGERMHACGAMDDAIAKQMYTPVNAAYQHNAPPDDPTQGFEGAKWGTVARLAAIHVAGLPFPPGRTNATTVVSSSHYTADFNEVVKKGVSQRANGTRSLAEEIVGIYWGYDGPQELGTPPRLYLQVVLSILDDIEARNKNRLSVEEELDVIAMIAISLADAGIDAWHYKYSPEHMMWRPALGIPNAVSAHGTAPVPTWKPLGRPATNGADIERTPNFPAYPSGHATFGAAAFQLLRLFLVHKGAAKFVEKGIDNVDFDFTSDEFGGRNRDPRNGQPRPHLTVRYPSLWKAITDNSVSRVYLGVHWQFDGITERKNGEQTDSFGVPANPKALGKTGGVWLGFQIANQLALKLGVPQSIIDQSM